MRKGATTRTVTSATTRTAGRGRSAAKRAVTKPRRQAELSLLPETMRRVEACDTLEMDEEQEGNLRLLPRSRPLGRLFPQTSSTP